MRVYVVFFASGRIYGIYTNKSKALKEVEQLNNVYYDNATIKEYRTE